MVTIVLDSAQFTIGHGDTFLRFAVHCDNFQHKVIEFSFLSETNVLK